MLSSWNKVIIIIIIIIMLDRLSSLPVQKSTYFRQLMTTALIDSAVEREWL